MRYEKYCLIISFLFIFGCSTGNPVSTKSDETLCPLNGTTTVNVLGAYELLIDVDSMTADLVTKRQSSIGESWTISGKSYFETPTDCFTVSGLVYEYGMVTVKFSIKHPFQKGDIGQMPSARNRLDLDIFDLAMVVVPQPLELISYPSLNINIPSYIVDQPDGLMNEFSAPFGSEIALPYALVIDDSSTVPSSNTYNKFEMGSTASFEARFPMTHGQSLLFDLYLTFGYGYSAVLADRLNPEYFNPEFNRKPAWKVEVIPPQGDNPPIMGNTWTDMDSSVDYSVTVKVYDWQMGANVNPDLDNPTDIYAASGVDFVSAMIPGMLDTPITVTGDSYSPGGTGMPDSPLVYNIPVANENLLGQGDYTGLIAVYDERSPLEIAEFRDYLIHTTDAGKNLVEFEIPSYVTYQTFTATVVHGEYQNIGNLIWAKEIDGYNYSPQVTESITTLSDNTFVMTGYFYKKIRFGPDEPFETILSTDGTDVFIARYNPNGTLVWAKNAGGNETERSRAYGITSLSDNSVVITGTFEETVIFGRGEANETPLTAVSNSDVFIARFNQNGVLMWAKSAGGDGSDNSGNDVTVLPDDSFIITGKFRDTIIFGEGEPNETTLTAVGVNTDAFIARYNSDGTLLWAKSANGSNHVSGNAITTLSDDSVVITGIIGGSTTFGEGEPNETQLTSSGQTDVFVARYNSDGALVWAKSANGSHANISNDITTLSDDSVVITGSYRTTTTFGSGEANETQLVSGGYEDIFVAKYNSNGSLAWAKRAGSANPCFGNGVTTLNEDAVVVTGYFRGLTVFGEGEPNETQFEADTWFKEVFVARYNPDDSLLWVKRAGGTRSNEGDSITTLLDNSTIVAGNLSGPTTFGPGEPRETILTGYGMFVARYEP